MSRQPAKPSPPRPKRNPSSTFWLVYRREKGARRRRLELDPRRPMVSKCRRVCEQSAELCGATAFGELRDSSVVRSTTGFTRTEPRGLVLLRAPCPLRDAWLAARITDVGLWLLRVEVGDDGEHAPVVVGGLREPERAEDVLDVLLDGVLGDV